MALKYHPAVGEIVMCEFPACFAPPEMIKTRPVVVVSPRLKGRPDLVTVVPLSTTEPEPLDAHHVRISGRLMPKCFQARATESWAKCDMVYTLSLGRLSMVEGTRDRKTGKRSSDRARLDLEHIRLVRAGISIAVGIDATLFTVPAPAPAPVIDPVPEPPAAADAA